MSFLRRTHPRWILLLLLLMTYARLVRTLGLKSTTFDEVVHIMQGVHYWQGERLYSVTQNPPLVNAWIGLWAGAGIAPTFPEMARIANWLALTKSFMWTLNDNGLQMLYAGRLAVVALSLLTIALVARWAWALYGRPAAAVLAAAIVALDPNWLAHSYLATVDVGLSFALLVAGYAVWRHWRPSNSARRPWSAALPGLAVGLALAAKFSALILLPALMIIAVWRGLFAGDGHGPQATAAIRLRRIGRDWATGAGWLLLGLGVMLVAYRFNLDTLGLDFNWQRQHQLGGRSGYLLGDLNRGDWRYTPIVFAAKTPLPLLALWLAGACFRPGTWLRDWQRLWPVLLALGVLGAGVVSRVNLGYRYLLPALPFLAIHTAALVSGERWPRRLALASAAWLLAVSIWAHPHYLAFFNPVAGGPDNGWRIAVDSNVDWGQDLVALAALQADDALPTLNASYLGTAPPEVYGVEARLIDGWPWGRIVPETDWFYPPRPAPGVYALSVTQLTGVYLGANTERFAYFRDRAPNAKAGYSIHVYDVPPDGPPVGVGLSGIGVGAIPAADYARLGDTNDVRLRWYDARTAFIWPGGDPNPRLVVGVGHRPSHPWLADLYPPAAFDGGDAARRFTVYTVPQSPLADLPLTLSAAWSAEDVVPLDRWPAPLASPPGAFGGELTLLGVDAAPAADGAALELLSGWRVINTPAAPLRVFVHLLNPDGTVAAQHDGLDVTATSLRPGDEVSQLHRIPLDGVAAGTYGMQIGVYRVESGERLWVDVGGGVSADRLLLLPLTLP